jgi:ribosomal protein S12 methylthiotransferase accessory factor
VEVKDFLTDDEILVPHRLVQTDYSNNRHGLEGRMFYSTTSGLSAGGTWEEAFVQGLYEVIERDACHMTLEKMKVTNDFAGIDMESLPAVVQALTEQVEAAGCRIVMMDCASEVDVRVYAAWIVDMEEPEIGVFRGYGAHLNGEIAATRAICEAVQARTVLMAGARDDYNHAKYLQNCRTGAAGTRALAEVKGSVEFQRGYENECDELREVVARCVEGGFDKILYYNFEVPEWCDVSVVRVMVPGMEGYWTPHVARLNEGRFRI